MDDSMIFRPSAPLVIAALRFYGQQQNLFEIVNISCQTSLAFFKQTLLSGITLVGCSSWSEKLPLLNCFSSLADGCDSSDTRVDSAEPCELAAVDCNVLCCRAGT